MQLDIKQYWFSSHAKENAHTFTHKYFFQSINILDDLIT